VAVVQISRIQHRRGQENSGSGLPQLASGELGWAIDTQKLYIGNGSVSEGAPQVGNTQILTEHSNLFDFADTYTYTSNTANVQTGVTSTNPVRRTLQERLDDKVSVKAFNCAGDGTDCTTDFQRAVDQLFLNSNKSNPASRVVLVMEPGTYTISDTIYLPPFVTILGAGVDKTVIVQTTNNPAFQTVNGSSTIGSYANDATSTFLNQAREITLTGFTITTTSSQSDVIVLQSCRNSNFKDIKISGPYLLGDSTPINSVGIKLNALSTVVTCSENNFENITVTGLSHGIVSDYDVVNNRFYNCKFYMLEYGIVFAETTIVGTSTGPSHNIIEACIFDMIHKNGVWIESGQYNQSLNNHFYNVGNEGGTAANALHSVILYNDDYNMSSNDYFERAFDLAVNNTYATSAFVPLVGGSAFFDYNFVLKTSVNTRSTSTNLVRLPALRTGSYTVEYWYDSANFNILRSGRLDVVFDKNTGNVEWSDEYSYVGTSAFALSLKFSIALSADTLQISASNALTIGEFSTIQLKITSKA
jgi:hypothetical protein